MGRETRRNLSHERERAAPARWAPLMLMLMVLAPRAGSAQQSRANASPSVPADEHVLRVCADPDNLPSTNRNGEGFDNKIAASDV